MTASVAHLHRDYTIGWVCALRKEQTAATAMLDTIHDDLPNPPNDPNAYTLGSIGKHNIIIACLPEGKYGANAATTTATWMVSTFPSVRFGLMVGIGGGIPSNGVRLGDVVVSKPDSCFPGVVQWDRGKIERGGTIEHTGSLNNPPTALLTSLAKLGTKREMEGSKIPDYIAAMAEKWPNLAAKYTRSESLRDILFGDDCPHVEGPLAEDSVKGAHTDDTETEEEEENDARDCRFCDITQARKRKPRATRIHYGLIASGNMVIKDAQFRNQLNDRFSSKILCVEMEAAGLMNDFPCLVIRGICDYADSHKNKVWQEYAAAVAAAFAKELLLIVPAHAVEQMDTITTSLSDLRCDVGLAVEYLEEARADRRDEKDERILSWLSPLDYGAEHSDILKRWEPGTGQWLLDSAEFREFIECKSQRVLFCPGIPGAGKTIMTATVIDYLHKQFCEDSRIGIAYIYFNFKRCSEQDPTAIFSSLLQQVSRQQPALHDSVISLYMTHAKRNTRPLLKEIVETFQDVVKVYSTVFVAIDALDECATLDHRRDIFLSEIIGCTGQSNLKLFATARHISEISEKFRYSLRLEIKAVEADIRKYIDSRLSKLPPTSVISQSQTLQKEIKVRINVAVGGMFLLAQLHFDQLTDCLTQKAVMKTLEALPTGSDAYDCTYNAAMDRISQQSSSRRQLAINVLSWITHAMRPLSVVELQYALGVEIGEDEFDEANLPQIDDIMSTSLGLVTIDAKRNVIRLVHYTTQEFFERNQKKWFPNAKTYIAQVCSCYLSYSAFKDELCEFKSKMEKRFKLLDYAMSYWHNHVSMSEFSQENVNFLKDTSNLAVFEYNFHRRRPNAKLFTGLHIAAESGWNEIVEALLKDIADADAHDEFNRTPFFLAASGGHDKVMRTLLNSSQIDVNVISSESRYTPLICAAQRGHAAAVKLLLDTSRVNVGYTCKRQKAALWYAAVGGHLDATRLLLDTRIYDTDMVREIFSSALLGAVIMKKDLIVSILLETGYADVNVQTTNEHSSFFWGCVPRFGNNTRGYPSVDTTMLTALDKNICSCLSTILRVKVDQFHDTTWRCPSTTMVREDDKLTEPTEYSLNQGKSPLCLAAEFGCESLIKILLGREEINVDLPAKDLYLSTALSMAARCGSIDIIRLLLNSGRFDINAKDGFGQTPLMIATYMGHEKIVKLLLQKNSLAIDLQDEQGRTAVFHAVGRSGYNGYDMARLIINTGKANINIKDAHGRSPLFYAIMHKSEQIVRLLFRTSGADMNAHDDYGRSLLLLAVYSGRKNIVKMCLDTGKFDINARDHSDLTPLLLAARNPSYALDIIQLLLDTNNVDFNARDCKHQRTALLWATYSGHLESFTVLLQTGKFDINERDVYGLTPFTLAAQKGNKAIVKLLIDVDAVDLHTKDYEHNRTALMWAASTGSLDTFATLLETGEFDVNEADAHGLTPFTIAVQEGQADIIGFLLKVDGG